MVVTCVAPAPCSSLASARTRRSNRGLSTVAVAERTTTTSLTPRSVGPCSLAKRSSLSSSARLESVALVTSSSPDNASPRNAAVIALAATSATAQPASVSHGRRLLHTASRSVIAPGRADSPPAARTRGGCSVPLTQRVAGSIRIREQRPPTEVLSLRRHGELDAPPAQLLVGRLDVGTVEEHRRVRQLVEYLSPRFVGGARTQDEQRRAVGRAHLDPALIAVRLVAAQLEPHAVGPELLGALLIVHRQDHLADPGDHASLLALDGRARTAARLRRNGGGRIGPRDPIAVRPWSEMRALLARRRRAGCDHAVVVREHDRRG